MATDTQEYPVEISSNIIEQVSIDEPNTFETGLLDASVLTQDKVFEGIVKAISPEVISAENKALIDSFTDILVEASPISINIVDFFSKNPNIASIDSIQDELAQMYLQNFHFVWNKAKNDYKLKNKLNNLLKQYRELTGSLDNGDFNFFENEDELYTTERYILAKEFKQKKGTTTAIEYAYRVAWLSDIEGPLKETYDFNIKTETCKGFSNGFYIHDETVEASGNSPATYNYEDYPTLISDGETKISQESGEIVDKIIGVPFDDFGILEPQPDNKGRVPAEETSGYSKYINTFSISENVDDEPCFPFRYIIEGSMLPAFFEAFVIPLAHPAGFRYIYTKLFKIAWIDYFNVELIYRADEVYVSTLCPEENCSETSEKTLYAAPAPVESVTGSEWRIFEEGKIDYGEFKGAKFEKYIFENKSYLIQYTFESLISGTERIIHYFDVPKMRNNNIVKNPDFTQYTYWTIKDGSKWFIQDGKAFSLNADANDIMEQESVLEKDKTYLIEVSINGVSQDNPAFLRIGKWEIFEEKDNGTGELAEFPYDPPRYEEVIKEFTENITYDYDYIARGGEKLEFYTTNKNGKFEYSIDSVFIAEKYPEKIYTKGSHSIIGLINAKPPLPILYTHDIFNKDQGMHYFPTDYMIGLFNEEFQSDSYNSKIGPLENSLEGNLVAPIELGNMIVNEFYYGQAKYKTTGITQLVPELHFGDTVDYVYQTYAADSVTELGVPLTRYIYKSQNSIIVDNSYTKDITINAGMPGTEQMVNVPRGYKLEYTYIYGTNTPTAGYVEITETGIYSAQQDQGDIYLFDLTDDRNDALAVGDILQDPEFWGKSTDDLNTTDFKNESLWDILLVNIDPDTEVKSITNEGGFVIGGKIIPWGDPDTAYMREFVDIERTTEIQWQNSFVTYDQDGNIINDWEDFKYPTVWYDSRTLGVDWKIIEGSTPESNYMQCHYPYHIDLEYIKDESNNIPFERTLVAQTNGVLGTGTTVRYTLWSENPAYSPTSDENNELYDPFNPNYNPYSDPENIPTNRPGAPVDWIFYDITNISYNPISDKTSNTYDPDNASYSPVTDSQNSQYDRTDTGYDAISDPTNTNLYDPTDPNYNAVTDPDSSNYDRNNPDYSPVTDPTSVYYNRSDRGYNAISDPTNLAYNPASSQGTYNRVSDYTNTILYDRLDANYLGHSDPSNNEEYDRTNPNYSAVTDYTNVSYDRFDPGYSAVSDPINTEVYDKNNPEYFHETDSLSQFYDPHNVEFNPLYNQSTPEKLLTIQGDFESLISGIVDLNTEDFNGINWTPYISSRSKVSLIERKLDVTPNNFHGIEINNNLIDITFNLEFEFESIANNNSYLDFTLGTPSIHNYTEYEDISKEDKIIRILLGDTVDYFFIAAHDFEVTRTRYKALYEDGVNDLTNFKTENFEDDTRWELIPTNNIVRYQKSGTHSWMGYYHEGDQFVFGASNNFKGKINSVTSKWIHNHIRYSTINDLIASNDRNSYIEFKWSEQSEEESYIIYNLERRVDDTQEWETVVEDLFQPGITPLTTERIYNYEINIIDEFEFRIQGTNEFGSTYSNTVIGNAIKLSSVVDFRGTNYLIDEIKFNWTEDNNDLSVTYEIERFDGVDWIVIENNILSPYILSINDLPDYNEYNFRLNCITDFGNTYSNETTAKAETLSLITDFTGSDDLVGLIEFNWTETNLGGSFIYDLEVFEAANWVIVNTNIDPGFNLITLESIEKDYRIKATSNIGITYSNIDLAKSV